MTDPALVAEPVETPALVADTAPPVDADAVISDEALVADPELKKVKKEAQDLRKRLRDAEADLEARKQAEMTETQRLQAIADKATADLALLAEKAKTASLKAAVAIDGRVPADLALPLIQGQVEYDELGDPTNVGALLAALVEKHPVLAGKPAPNSGMSAAPGGESKPPETDDEALARIYGQKGIDVTRNPELLGGGVVMNPD